jgi:hypothetical protein
LISTIVPIGVSSVFPAYDSGNLACSARNPFQ